MSEANLHFKIKEYIMKLSSKKEIIEELNGELERLNKIKNKLSQTKSSIKEEYKKFEKQNKSIINSTNLIKETNFLYNLKYKNKLNNNIGIKDINKTNYKKRNFSATKPRKRLDINIVKDLIKQNNELEDNLINYNHELNNIIQTVNEMEIKCKLLMINTKNTNLIDIQNKK